MYYKDEIVEEVRRTREELVARYPTFDALEKHWEEDVLPRMKTLGCKFVTTEKVLARGKEQD